MNRINRVGRIADHLRTAAPLPAAAVDINAPAAVLEDPPDNWPEWLPFPVHTEVPRFALGDREANAYLEKEGVSISRDSPGSRAPIWIAGR